jgi:heterodisulfide reductase subunit A-like polyferredoxin
MPRRVSIEENIRTNSIETLGREKCFMQNTASKRVLILGGGFAGLTVAMELDKKLARNRDAG